MDFTSPETASISFPGGSDTIEHELYGYADKQSYLFGAWSFEYQILASVFTEWVDFNGTYTGSDGTPYVSGYIDSLPSTTAALGLYSNGQFIISVADGDFTDLYVFPVSDDRHMIGKGDIYTSGETVSSPQYNAVGNRLFSQAELTAQDTHSADLVYSIPSFPTDNRMPLLEAAIKSVAH